MSYDVRAVANLVLDIADKQGQKVSNLRINKIIYFLHVGFLHEFGAPLVSAKIEAWDHGPVFREIYHQFKRFGRGAITEHARRINVATGLYDSVPALFEKIELEFLSERCLQLLRVPAGVLVEKSHVEGGAWHRARHGDGRINPGVEITNQLIMSCFETEMRH